MSQARAASLETPSPASEARPLALRLTPRDLRRLREACLAAQRANLESQLAQHWLATLTLELEWRYGLLGMNASINVHTGSLSVSKVDEAGASAQEDGGDHDPSGRTAP